MAAAIKHYATLLAALIVLALVWNHFRDRPAPVGATVLAKPAPELKRMATVDIAPPKVRVYVPKAKKSVALPQAVQDDQNKYVLDSAKLSADTHPHTITTVIDQTTGEVQTFDRRDPLPWLAAEQTGEVRIDSGIKGGVGIVGRLSLREDLLQVKALHAGVHAALDTDGTWFVGGGVGWRW